MTAPYVPGGNRPGDGPLRPNGVSVAGIPMREQDLPSTPSKIVERQRDALQLVRDIVGGTAAVRAKSTVYLPKNPGEEPQLYQMRLIRSVLFNAFGYTVEGLTGFVFRKDPILGDDVPVEIAGTDGKGGHWENIDNAGTHGDVFAREVFQDAETAGHAAILVEYPNTGGQQSAAAEKTGPAPIRPYWVPILKENIVSFRTAVENGVTVLTQLVLRECTMVADGEYGEKEQERFRVLYRDGEAVGWRLLEISKNREIIPIGDGKYPTQTEIPVAEITTSGSKGLFDSDPPLLDLAYLNICHYQQHSDYLNSIHKTCVPIFVRIGFRPPQDAQGNDIVLGPNAGLDLPEGGDAKYVSHDGAALGSVREALDDLKGQMAMLGLAQLAQEKRTAETAEGKRIDKAASDSALSVSARGLQDGLERALQFHARYMGLDSGGSITINRDFENLTLEPQQISALSQLVASGQLTIETLWKMLAEGNVLPEDFDAEQEKSDIEAEAEIKRQEALELAAATPVAKPAFGKPAAEAA